eukprot:11233813-Ditylum_brightwellii.AAC.2
MALALIHIITDSTPIGPYEVDAVILHTAEHFDVELIVPLDIPNSSNFIIHADTLESRSIGFNNGVQSVLHATNTFEVSQSEDKIYYKNDPQTKIMPHHQKVLNFYSLSNNATDGCLPLTVL